MPTFFVIATLTPAKNCAFNTTLIAFTILFKAFSFFALTTFFYFLVFDPQTKDIINRDILIFHFLFELKTMCHGMGVSSECFYNRLLVFLFILLNIAATMAIAIFITIHLFLEALAVQFETSGPLAVAAKFFLFCEYLLLLLINLRDYYYIPGTPVTSLRKRR